MIENKKHSKHAKLSKPQLGTFGRNEWALIGAPCDIIKELVSDLQGLLEPEVSTIFIDESHKHDEGSSLRALAVKRSSDLDVHQNITWNKNGYRTAFNSFDLCLVNGNHFVADKQIVLLHPKKKESLSRKLDRLTNVRCFIATEDQNEAYDFLKEHIEDWKDVPIFQMSDATSIANFMQEDAKVADLKLLILAGGKSQRMGHDKGKIDYHGEEQRKYLYAQLGDLVEEVHISCRQDQVEELAGYKTISDKFVGLGPFGAIASAFMADPNSAWIVVPCDLPLLTKKEIEFLINKRDPYKFGTAFLNNETQFPEPLISIWEPKMYLQMLSFLTQGYSCPRKVLINSDVKLIEVADQKFMMNVNTPKDKSEVSAILNQH